MMVGSEGVLGVFTEITLRLRPLPRRTITFLAFFDKTTAATDAVFEIVRNGLEPAAIEYLDQRVIKAMSEYKGLGLPNADALILLEMHGIDDHVIDMNERNVEEFW